MNKLHKLTAVLLSALLLTAPLVSCAGDEPVETTGSATNATTVLTTTDTPDGETPDAPPFTPGDVYAKMKSSYRLINVVKINQEDLSMKVTAKVERKGSLYRLEYTMDIGNLAGTKQITYYDTQSGKIYQQVDGKWYYSVDKAAATEEAILTGAMLLLMPKELLSNANYNWDNEQQVYKMKQAALKKATGYEGDDLRNTSLTLAQDGKAYAIKIIDGSDGTTMETELSFSAISITLPNAVKLPDEEGGGDIGGGEDEAENPYIMSDLLFLLEDRELLYVDSSSVALSGMTVWGGEGPENLFDGKTTKCGGDRYNSNNLIIDFALHEPATVTTYVLTTANDTASFPARNPVEWTLYGTNDPWSNDWTVLDYVWDGNLYSENFVEHGYLVDTAMQEEYLYYRLEFGYASGTQFQLSEIRLYAGGVNPEAPEDPDHGDNIGGAEVEEDPYILQYLTELLRGKQMVAVKPSSIRVQGMTEWEGEGVDHLFDGVLSKGGGNRTAAETIIYFALNQPARLSAYVFVTGNDTARFPLRNPVEWQLLGTNDPYASANNGINLEDWTVLDYVWDGGMIGDNYFENGYAIDPENQGEYQYYALMLGYSAEPQFQLAEIYLYADGGDGTGGDTEPDSDLGVYVGSDLNGLVSGRNSLTDLGKIDLGNQYSVGFTPWNYDEDMHRLFDGIDTFDEWYYNPDGSLKEGAMPDLMEGGGPGKCSGMVMDGRAYFFFSTYEKETVEAYVLTTANDSAKFSRNPYSFALYATNEPDLFESYGLDYGSWVLLDSPVSGCMKNQNFVSYGFTVDNPGAYRYYCLAIEYVPGTQFQLGELALYIAG